jgi:uncharacterized membrane protein YdjX (TVP38/TMEM64 family)
LAVAREGWQIVALLRLSPVVPFNLQNYALGVTAIPFWRYVSATLVGMIPGALIYVYFGTFGNGLGRGVGAVNRLLFAGGALATIALGVLVTRQAKTKFDDDEKPGR